jgi:IPT/TIG domain
MSRFVSRTAIIAFLIILTGCAQSARLVVPAENAAGNRIASLNASNKITVEVSFHSRANQATFKAELDGVDVTSSFPVAGSPRSGQIATTPGSHTLRLIAAMSPRRSGDSTARNYQIQVPVPPVPLPTSVTAVAPSSGIVGTPITLTGSGFHPSHGVKVGSSNVSSTHVSTTQKTFKVQQKAPGNFSVQVAGVSGPQLTINPGTLSTTPSPVNLAWNGSETLTVNLPLPAPPGGVDLTATPLPAGILQLSSSGNLAFSSGNSSQTLQISTANIGTGTLSVAGIGYTTVSIPFTVSLGAPQCSARPRAAGGVEFVSLASGSVVSVLTSTSTPGRVVAAPGGARAVAQYTTGISFLDLVNCSGLGSFQSSTIPLVNFAFSGDGQFFAADWFHNTQNDGMLAYRLVDASQLFSRNTTSNSHNVKVAGDSAGHYVFWITSTNTPQGAQPQLGIHALTNAPGSCFFGNIANTNFSVVMSGGVATLNFGGGNPAINVRASDCQLMP